MSEVISIENKLVQSANDIASKINDKEIRKRAYALAVSALTAAKYLNSIDINIETKYSLFKIPSFAQNIELADIYSGDARIDVRVSFDGRTFSIPKTHGKYKITPDAYFVLKLDPFLENAEILGFVNPDVLEYPESDNEYYNFPTTILQPATGLRTYINSLRLKIMPFSSEENEKIKDLAASFIDDEIPESEKIYFIQHVIKCTQSREMFCELCDFDNIVSQVKKHSDLLDDSTLSVLSGNPHEYVLSVDADEDLTEEDTTLEPIEEISETEILEEETIEELVEDNSDESKEETEEEITTPVVPVEPILAAAVIADEAAEAAAEILSIAEDSLEIENKEEETNINDLIELNDDVEELPTLEHNSEEDIIEEIAVDGLEELVEKEEETSKIELLEENFEADLEEIETLDVTDEPKVTDEPLELLEEVQDNNTLAEVESEENSEPIELLETIDSPEEADEEESIEFLEESLEDNLLEVEPEEIQEITEIKEEANIENTEIETLDFEENIIEEKQELTTEPVETLETIEDYNPIDTESDEPTKNTTDEDVQILEEDNLEVEDLETLDELITEEETTNQPTVENEQVETINVLEELSDEPATFNDEKPFGEEELEDVSFEDYKEDSIEEISAFSEVNETVEEDESKQIPNLNAFVQEPVEVNYEGEEIVENNAVQNLLDNELKALLSEDTEQTVLGDTDENIEQIANTEQVNTNENIEALFEDTNQENPEQAIDVNKEPVSTETSSAVKKVLIGAALLVLLAGGAGAAWFINNKPAEQNTDMLDTANKSDSLFNFDNKGNGDNDNAPAVSQDINKSMANSFSDKPAAITVTKISWQISEKLAMENSVKEYLQTAGKNIQMNLQNDLANASDVTFNPSIKISFEIAPDNTLKGMQVLESSGSDKIDEMISKSIKDTLKYVSVPKLNNYKSDYFLTIVINF